MRLAKTLRGSEVKSALLVLSLGLLFVLGTIPQVNAQVLYGTLVGTVKDPSGAAVPGATVTMTQTQTQLTRSVTSDQSGSFTASTVSAGTYTVRVEAQGFKSYSKTGVIVSINTSTRVDATLELGAVNQSVEVSATAAVLQTERADVHHDLTAATIENIPLPAGNNFQQLFRAIPGFNPPTSAHSVGTNPSRSLQFNVNGASSYGNDVRIDGISQYNIWVPENTAYIPSSDSIQVVNVVTGSFNPDQGLAGGSSINVQIKSGTNQWHGDVYEYHYDNGLEARGFFDPKNHISRVPKDIFNQFGGSIGGPIKKDKLFFFVNVEPTRQAQFATSNNTVATAAMRNGDMRGLDLTKINPAVIFDPASGSAGGIGRAPFMATPAQNSACQASQADAPDGVSCLNVIPTARISPTAAKMMSMMPLPNIPNGSSDHPSSNYLAATDVSFNRITSDSKIDWNKSDKFTMYGHLGLAGYNTHNPQVFDPIGGPQASGAIGNEGRAFGHTYSYAITGNYVATPTFVIDASFGLTRMVANSEQLDVKTTPGTDILGIPGVNGTRNFEGSWPEFDISSYSVIGTQHNFMPYYRNDPQVHLSSNASWIKNKHTLRFGIDIIGQHLNHQQPEWNGGGSSYGPQGGFLFGNGPTQCKADATNDCGLGLASGKTSSSSAYNSFSSFLLGVDTAYGKNVQIPDIFHTVTHEYSLYVGDQWQVTNKLTASLGVRWEYFPFPTRGGSRGLERLDFSNNNVRLCGVAGNPIDCGTTVSDKSFAPRIGLAYRASNSFVLRAGYGITYEPYNIVDNLRTNYPILIPLYVAAPDSISAAGTLDAFGQSNVPVGQTVPVGIPLPVAPDLTQAEIPLPGNVGVATALNSLERGYIQSWNVTLEKQLPGGWLAQAGYVASRTIKQLGTLNLNVQSSIGPAGCDPSLLNCGGNASLPFGLNSTDSTLCPDTSVSTLGCHTAGLAVVTPLTNNHYDALQATLSHHFANGYQLQFNYTWSKTIGMAGVENEKNSARIQDPAFYYLNRGLAPIDRPQNFEAVLIAESPFGAKKRWVNSGIGAKILGDWQFSTLISAVSGSVVTMSSSGSSLNASGNNQRPDIVGPIKILKNAGPGEKWFDTSAFAGVTDQRYGTSSFYPFHGPGVFNMDAALARNFKLSERFNLQFRAQAVNFTNTAHFNNPDTNCGSFSSSAACNNSTFGEISSTTNLARDGIDQRQFEFALKLSF
jgi:Carboxypeptidase regulatory-like domain/TonB dependent receptor-like, beta-barrel/TonB-dependent Receptor Plug Domain